MEKKKRQDILILKTGYSEVLFEGDSKKVSLGDILRITPILHLYKNDNVTWVTDKAAFPLLEGNPYINKLLALDFTTAMHLLEDEFDTIINLEKNIEVCKLSKKLEAWARYGFRFDKKTNQVEAYDRALEVLTYSSSIDVKKESSKTVQELLFKMVGEKWKGEEYILGYKPKKNKEYDVCLNTKVGEKWPVKAWPIEYWNKLEEMLVRDNIKVQRQDKQNNEILTNLKSYMDWINSSKVVISNDSLGLHLGIALKKKAIGLFGPTTSKEVCFYDRGEPILPKPHLDCLPCFNESCGTGHNCMEKISPERVYKTIKKYL
tara:strand:- start:469 stop:1422 length:954 start_codon:yes stop_codon:yes gene_type:complete